MPQRAARIAVVDDDRSYIEMMRDLLSDEGFDVVCYRSSAEARAGLPAAEVDLIILDLWIEHAAAGRSLVDWLRSQPATRGTPLVISSGDSVQLERYARRCDALVCTALRKPFELDEMLSAVRGMLPASPHAVAC